MAVDITIVIPSRNRARRLPSAINSALGQVDIDAEVIVVDDGSIDDVSRDLAYYRPHGVRVITHPHNLGVSAARNSGLFAASASFTAFLDDDDTWAPVKLRSQLARFAVMPKAAWSFTAARSVSPGRQLISVDVPPMCESLESQLLVGNVIPGGGSSVVVKTEAARELGGFDENLSALADWDLWIRLAASFPAAIVDEPLTDYLLNPDGMIVRDERILDEFDRLVTKHADRRTELGIEADRERFLEYLLFRRRLSGWRWGSLRAEASLMQQRPTLRRAVGMARTMIKPSHSACRPSPLGVTR